MSLSDRTIKISYLGDTSTVNFAMPDVPVVDDSAEVKVYIRDESVDPATETLQVEGSDYNLTGSPGGDAFHTTVTFLSAPVATDRVVIYLELPYTQTSDFTAGQGIPPESLETELDRLEGQIQQLREQLTRVPKLPITEQISEAGMALPEPGASEVVGWNAGGTALTTYSAADLVAAAMATIDHTAILNIGSNSHTQIDTHIADSSIHFTAGSIDHDALTNYVPQEHIDWTQAGAGTIHVSNYVDNDTNDHTALSNIGTNTHNQIDAHIASTANPHSVAIDDVSPLTTKGDLHVFTTVDTRLGVGTNDQVLTADSAQASGVKWAAVPTQTEAIVIACSDETTDLEVGTATATFRMPYGFTLTEVRASVTTAPTGSVLTVDINESGTTILSTKLTIDAGEKTSTTAATAAVISDSALADDAEITIDIDGVGSTVAGAGLKVYLIGTQA